MDFKPDLIDYWSSDAHVIECNKSDTTSKQCTYNLERNARKLTLIDSECNDYLMSLCFIGVINHKKFTFPNKVAKWNMKFSPGTSKNRLHFNTIIIHHFPQHYVPIIDDSKFLKHFFIGIVA